jgi:hypothetical protein
MTISRSLLHGAATLYLGTIGLAVAQPAAPPGSPPKVAAGYQYDPSQFPPIAGKVARYTLTPRGDVDGLLLADGTEIHVPPHLSAQQLVFVAKPGDAVTVRGLKALNLPLVDALSVTNDTSGQSVVDSGARGKGRGGPRGAAAQDMSVEGRVQATLHGQRGEVNGAMLEDGTILRLPPPEADRFATLLSPGQSVAVQGDGITTAMGRVVAVRAIGPSSTQLSEVAAPPPPPKRDRPPPPRGRGAEDRLPPARP